MKHPLFWLRYVAPMVRHVMGLGLCSCILLHHVVSKLYSEDDMEVGVLVHERALKRGVRSATTGIVL